jgi:hypothetical protein
MMAAQGDEPEGTVASDETRMAQAIEREQRAAMAELLAIVGGDSAELARMVATTSQASIHSQMPRGEKR